jgi:GNAT superfamily N-acetyltransferase
MTLPIRLLDPESFAAALDDLTALLVEAVDGHAAVTFLPPLDPPVARRFWVSLGERAAQGGAAIFAAYDGARVAGTTTLVLDTPANQRHRCEIAKMIVGREWRRRGLGRALLNTAIAHAHTCARTLIVLDTRTGDAGEALYRSVGFARFGIVPDYARDVDGRSEAASFYYLDLRPEATLDLAPYRLRAATDADSAAVIAHIAGIWAEYPGCVMDLAEESDLARVATSYTQAGGSIWVAEGREGALAATVAISPCESAPGGMLLGRLYVAKSARRGGLASKLLAFAESSARARGAAFMELWTDTRFKEAHEFYQARGYARLPGERALRDASDSYEFHFRKVLL